MILECLNCTYTSERNRRCEKCGEVLYPKVFNIPSITNVMGEGNTPMFSNQHLTDMIECKSLKIKNEGINPTGSFKDRGSAFETEIAKNIGYDKIVLASTGNMGASMAAYSTYNNLDCLIFVPEDTAQIKINQMEMYGAKIKKSKGNYNNCMLEAEKYAKLHNVFLAGDYFWRMIGMIPISKEILLNCNGIPEYIFVPVGNGNLLYSIYLGFKKLKYFRMPKIVGVQIEHYDSLVTSFVTKSKILPSYSTHKSFATAVNITNPLQGNGVLKAIKETDGYIMSVTDDEMFLAQKILAKKGLFLEPSGAISFAGILKQKEYLKDKNVVAIGTGHGLKGV